MKLKAEFRETNEKFNADFCSFVDLNADTYKKGYAEATQKAYDDFWDTYQRNGERTSYAYAFYGDNWNDETFNPKYKMIPTAANGMFDGCANITKPLTNDMVDFSNNNNWYQVFRGFGSKELGIIDTRKNGNNVYSYTFQKALCEKIELLILPDMTQYSNCKFNNSTFDGMKNLVRILFEGVIGNGSVIFASAQKLDSVSAESLLRALADYSGTDKEYSYTVTLTNTVWERLNAEIPSPVGDSWQEYVDSKGWNT